MPACDASHMQQIALQTLDTSEGVQALVSCIEILTSQLQEAAERERLLQDQVRPWH